jgi:hypothetical protein
MRTVNRMHVATMPHATESMTVKALGGLVEYWSWREGEAAEVVVVFMFMGGLAVVDLDLDTRLVRPKFGRRGSITCELCVT